MPKKCVLIVLDGLGDRSFMELNNRTPLQAAVTPTLDRLALSGANGLYHAGAFGQALPSENAHFIMFGYKPDEFPGRAVLEALGAGIRLLPEEVAVLAHLACVREEGNVLHLVKDDPGLKEEEVGPLFKEVAEYEKSGVKIRFSPTKGRFGVIILGGEVAPFITDTDPMRDMTPLVEVRPWKKYERERAARNTAGSLKSYLLWSYSRLRGHPVNLARAGKGKPAANALVTQRAGRIVKVPSFRERWGLRGLSVSSSLIYGGLASMLGMNWHKMENIRDPGMELEERIETARSALATFDFIHVHTKAPDEASNSKDPLVKKRVIESIDGALDRTIDPLINNPDVLVVITSDHSTPSDGGLIHSGEPVPLLICGRGVRKDRVKEFDEVNAAGGSLGCVRGNELIYLILNYLDRIKLAGLMDTPYDQPYWPGDVEPFRLDQ